MYSVHDGSWEGVAGSDYGGSVTWTAACFHQYAEEYVAPTCTQQGAVSKVCDLCGYRILDRYVPPAGHTPGEAVREGKENVVYCRVCGAELSRTLTYTPGDINGDGIVNNKDVSRLFQYLSNWDVEVVEDALDVNGDGNVNNKDAMRLFQYMSDWDVELC